MARVSLVKTLALAAMLATQVASYIVNGTVIIPGASSYNGKLSSKIKRKEL
jgi:hypothetical protein